MSGWRLHPLVGAARDGEVSDLHFETSYYAPIAWLQVQQRLNTFAPGAGRRRPCRGLRQPVTENTGRDNAGRGGNLRYAICSNGSAIIFAVGVAFYLLFVVAIGLAVAVC